MRTFGMWLLAGLFALAGWDAFERMDRPEARPGVQAPSDSGVRAQDDGTPAPPPPLAAGSPESPLS